MTELKHELTSLYAETSVSAETIEETRRQLRTGGVLAGAEGFFDAERSAACVGMVREHIRALGEPNLDEVRTRMRAWADLPVPHLPDAAPAELGFVEAPESDMFVWVDPRRVVPNRDVDKKFLDDTYYVKKVIADQASPGGLSDLFGTMDLEESSRIHGEEWRTPCGPIIRIIWNGNHRLAALAALGVPCVLVRVHVHRGSFVVTAYEERTERYRRLLQVFEVAAFPDGSQISSSAFSRWPILLTTPTEAVASLAAFEERVGLRVRGRIGELPRELFDDVAALERAAKQIADVQHYALLPAVEVDDSLLGRFRDWFRRVWGGEAPPVGRGLPGAPGGIRSSR